MGAFLSGLLPIPPARLLLLGDIPTAELSALITAGYVVTTSPYSPPGELAQYPTAIRQGIKSVRFTLPSTDFQADAVVAWDFGPGVHPLALFDQLVQCVVADGVVVLLGQADTGVPRMARWLEYVERIAARCGFAVQQHAPELVRVFHKTAPPRWQLRHVRAEDFADVAALFQEVFAQPLSHELWRWKYAEGRGNAVAARRADGTLIAHYGGMYRDVLLCGQPEWTFQICDVMVHPKERGVMTRQGPFLLTAATSAEIYGPLGFGFPNARAMAVAEKMGLYNRVGQMAEVRWQPNTTRIRWRTRIRALHPDTDKHHVETLWADMAADLRDGVVGVRDWNYVQHRYLHHPHHRYDVLLVSARFSDHVLGLMVLHRLEHACELMDIVAPLGHLPLLLDQARRLTARWQRQYLYCWISKNHLEKFTACAGTEAPLDITIPTSCWTKEPRAQVFQDKWWLMSGDTDFR